MAPTIDTDRLARVQEIDLDTGSHEPPNGHMQACVMEAVSYVAGEPWSDNPQCASPVISAFLRTWNDNLPAGDRQHLKQYIPRLVGSAGTPEQEDRRAWMAMDWLVRVHTPAWLRFAGLTGQANHLAGMPELSPETYPSIRPVLDAIRKDAYAAWAAARAAAAWAATGAASRAAAWAAARDTAARDAARDTAARDAAWDVFWAAADAASAWAAANGALEPTVRELQASAHDLVDRMIRVTEDE